MRHSSATPLWHRVIIPFMPGALAVLVALAPTSTRAGRQETKVPQTPPASGIYWCPMHPDVRSDRAGTCRKCGMDLVPARIEQFRSYDLDVEMRPRAPRAGYPVELRLTVRAPDGDEPVTRFETVHERLFHLFIVGHDLQFFAHEHPEAQADGAFSLRFTFPRPGAYRLIADMLPVGGAPQLLSRSVITADYAGPLAVAATAAQDLEAKELEGVRIHLEPVMPLAAEESRLTFRLTDLTSDAPIEDLEPWLGAPGHLLLVREDLGEIAHCHPLAGPTVAAGGVVTFEAFFPTAGTYRLWVQFQRNGIVVTAPFIVRVDPQPWTRTP